MTLKDQEIISMRLSGSLLREISEQVDLSIGTVRKVLRENNISKPCTAWYSNKDGLTENEIVDAIVAEYTSGTTMQQIADMHGMKLRAVRQILKNLGLSPSGRQKEKGIVNRAFRDSRILELRLGGATYGEIVKELGVCKSVVYKVCKKGDTNARRSLMLQKQRRETIILLYRNGLSYGSISRKAHTSYSQVMEVLRSEGLLNEKRSLTERDTAIMRMRKEGKSVKHIAEFFQMNLYHVYHILEKQDKAGHDLCA